MAVTPAPMFNTLESQLESHGTYQGLPCLVSPDVQFWFFQPKPAKNFAYVLKISNDTFGINTFLNRKSILISKCTSLAFFLFYILAPQILLLATLMSLDVFKD